MLRATDESKVILKFPWTLLRWRLSVIAVGTKIKTLSVSSTKDTGETKLLQHLGKQVQNEYLKYVTCTIFGLAQTYSFSKIGRTHKIPSKLFRMQIIQVIDALLRSSVKAGQYANSQWIHWWTKFNLLHTYARDKWNIQVTWKCFFILHTIPPGMDTAKRIKGANRAQKDYFRRYAGYF